jgi:hypothetical protein
MQFVHKLCGVLPVGSAMQWLLRQRNRNSRLESIELNNRDQTVFSTALTGPGINAANDNGTWAQDGEGDLMLIVREGDLLVMLRVVSRSRSRSQLV